MKEYSANIAVLHTLYAIYGYEIGKAKSIHAEITSKSFDRYGCKLTIQLMTGVIVSGRLSRAGRFNGTVSLNGTEKKYRSRRAA